MAEQWFMHTSGQVTQCRISRHDRPVVVIDPEDAEQVKRFDDLLTRFVEGDEVPDYEGTQGSTRAALREFAAPTPKPEEPTGLGAVVEDAEGRRFVRVCTFHTRDQADEWRAQGAEGSAASNVGWDRIAAVRVLSEGVTA